MPIGPIPAATATAAPPLDPPEVRSALQALRVRPKSGASVRALWPYSGVVVLPNRIAPADFMRAAATASSLGTLFSYRREPKVVRTPAVLTRSLAAKGMPCSTPSGLPSITACSASIAAASACSPAIVMKQFKTGCSFSARSNTALVSSTGETSFAAIRACRSEAGRRVRSSLIAATLAPPDCASAPSGRKSRVGPCRNGSPGW